MTDGSIHDRANPRKNSKLSSVSDIAVLRARGCLSNAKTLFAHRGWDELPSDERGQRILDWGADQAYLASPTNPARYVRLWCRRWNPRLTKLELDEIVAATPGRNKHYTPDQSALVLEVGVRDREALRLWFLGADDDPCYEYRNKAEKAKAAARACKYRTLHSTGAKRGRPALQLSEEERNDHERMQGAKRSQTHRGRAKSGLPRGRPKSGKPELWQTAGASSKSAYYRSQKATATAQVCVDETQNASRKNASRHISNKGSVTEFSGTDFESHLDEYSGAPEAPQRLAPPVLHGVLHGEIILDLPDDVALRAPSVTVPPPMSHTERALAFVRKQMEGRI
jgi:hypothetical protein